MATARHITLPGGFLAAGVSCGIKESGAEDLALIVGERAVAAAVMTTGNQVVGAPVLWCRTVLPTGRGRVRGIVINSGNSNVCTGRRGERDAETMAALAARAVGAKKTQMLVASTGIIGRPLPMAKVRRGIASAGAALGRTGDGAVVRAMMTTDTREKSAVVQTRLGRQIVTVAGIAKGSGMIAPSLAGPPPRRPRRGGSATMIAVVTTDAKVAPGPLQRAFRSAVQASFNAVTVDSDTSTSDTAVVMASGLAGPALRSGTAALRRFSGALSEVCGALAVALVRDGEGATKLIEVRVTGAAGAGEAEIAARSIADSPLVKCAVHGGDPNWGRILAAAGKSRARVEPERLCLSIGGTTLFSRGRLRKFDLRAVQRHLAGRTVRIGLDLRLGSGRFTAYTCDLSREYVAINADYHT